MIYVIDDNIFVTGDSYNGSGGYRRVYIPTHPRAPKSGEIYEHILVMEQKLNRFLTGEEVVHHIDNIKSNNDIDNLMLFENDAYHALYHAKKKILDACGVEGFVRCGICKKYGDPINEDMSYYGRGYEHIECRREYARNYKRKSRKRETTVLHNLPLSRC